MTANGQREDELDLEVANTVLSYLRAHPDAADTLEGITRWWLPRQRFERERNRIESVLQALTARGELYVRRLPDGAALYELGTNGDGYTPP